MLKGGVRRENRIVRLNNRVGHRRRGVHAKLELGLLAVICRETLEDERTETGASATAERVEDKEALEAIAVVGQPADLVHDDIDLFLADGVVTTSVYDTRQSCHRSTEKMRPLTVAGSIFLARHKSLGVEETPVSTVPNLINDIGLKVNVK